MKRCQKPKGFTLIELMIVVAIIGVISAIAVPAYQSHIAKTEVSAAVMTVKALLVNIEQEILNNGNFPTALDKIGANKNMNAMGEISLGSSSIIFTWKGTNNSITENQTVIYSRSETNGWSCELSSGINSDYQPKSCKSAPSA